MSYCTQSTGTTVCNRHQRPGSGDLDLERKKSQLAVLVTRNAKLTCDLARCKSPFFKSGYLSDVIHSAYPVFLNPFWQTQVGECEQHMREKT